METINDLYDYGLKIYQNTDYFKFSVDSILLAEFEKLKNNIQILDIATGNVPIPLILTTKCNKINIDAVELQKEIAELAAKSIEINNLSEKITLYQKNIKDYKTDKKYDIVTCNPPFFKNLNKSQKNENIIKSIARHEIELALEDVIQIASNVLKDNGTLYLVQRIERFLDTIDFLKKYRFGIREIIIVHTRKNKPAEFFLIEASRSKKSDPKIKAIDISNYKTYKNIFKED